MGLIGTRSVSKQIPGIHDIKEKPRAHLRGITAVNALEALRADRTIRRRSRPSKPTRRTWALACC
jgi:hypothetical protein